MTHYDTLGVAENANADEIKKAYRKLANQHHPDKGGDTNRFQQIQSAYDVLGDDNRRAQYDAERHGMGGFRFTVNGHDVGSGMPQEMEDILRNFGFAFGHGFANQGDPFSPFRQARRNKDIQVNVNVSLASTLESQQKTISVQNTNGDRYSVDVLIPRGVRSNSRIKFPNLGDNFFASLPRGDLYVQIQVEGDPRFHVDDYDLIKIVEIDCIQAMIGSTLSIEGLDNKKFDVTISPGTQHDSRFRIHNQGLYAMNQSNRGHLIVHVKIYVPNNLTSDQINSLRNTFNIQ
jgi:curved DNA-binding protein